MCMCTIISAHVWSAFQHHLVASFVFLNILVTPELMKKTSCRMLCIYPWTFEAIHALRDFCTNTSNCYILWWGPVTSKLSMGAVLSFEVCWFLPFAAFAVVFSQAQRRLFTGLQSGVVMVWAAQFHAWRVASEPMDNFHSESSLCDLEILTSNSIGIVPWIGYQ